MKMVSKAEVVLSVAFIFLFQNRRTTLKCFQMKVSFSVSESFRPLNSCVQQPRELCLVLSTTAFHVKLIAIKWLS